LNNLWKVNEVINLFIVCEREIFSVDCRARLPDAIKAGNGFVIRVGVSASGIGATAVIG